MRIREVLPAEGEAVRRLVTQAFLTAEHADGTEGELVGRLRASADHLPGYEIAAEDRGVLIGQAMMTRGSVPTKDGDLPVLVLAPVCVALSHRRKGVGARLVETLLAKGRRDGWSGAVVLGDPAYYGRFGFVEASSFGWIFPFDAPPECALAQVWKKDLPEAVGPVRFSAVFGA